MANEFFRLQEALQNETVVTKELLTDVLYGAIKVLRKGRTAVIETTDPQEKELMLQDFVAIAEGLSTLAVDLVEEEVSDSPDYSKIDASSLTQVKDLLLKYDQDALKSTDQFHSGSIAEKILTILTTIQAGAEENKDFSEWFLRAYGADIHSIPSAVDVNDVIENPEDYVMVAPLSAGLVQFALIAAYIKKHRGKNIEIATVAMNSENLVVQACQTPDLSRNRKIFVADDVIEPNMAKNIEKYLEEKTIPENKAPGTNQTLISFNF